MTVQRHKEGKKHPLGAMLLSAKPLMPLPSPNPLRLSPPLLSAQVTSQGRGSFGLVPWKRGATSTQSLFQNQPWGGSLSSSRRQVLCPHPDVGALLLVPFKGLKENKTKKKKTKKEKKPDIIFWKLLHAGRVTQMLYELGILNLDGDSCCC